MWDGGPPAIRTSTGTRSMIRQVMRACAAAKPTIPHTQTRQISGSKWRHVVTVSVATVAMAHVSVKADIVTKVKNPASGSLTTRAVNDKLERSRDGVSKATRAHTVHKRPRRMSVYRSRPLHAG
jgi:hypothetical protein